MEKFAITYTVNKDVMKMLIDDPGGFLSVLGEARENINKGFEDIKKDQDDLTAKNSGLDVDGYEILDINAGDVMMYMNQDILTQIKGKVWRLSSAGSGERACQRMAMVGCYWISILIIFWQWWINSII